MAGVTDTGFVSLSRDEIVSLLNSRFKGQFGEQFDTSPESPDGQLIGIIADQMATIWAMGEDVFNSWNPATSAGIVLDNAVRINGIERSIDTATTAPVDLTGVASTLVPAGSLVSTEDGIEFTTDNDVIIPGSTTVTCTTSGPIEILANEITVIVNPQVGWDTVNNPNVGVTGIDRETDTQLRVRREKSVVRTGTDTADAIISALSGIGVESVLVLENDTGVSVDGIPANSFETVVDGGILIEIAKKIYQNKPIGITAFGDNIVAVIDSQGKSHNIGISRPTSVIIDMEVTIKKDLTAPSDAGDLVKQAMVDHIDTFNMGDDVKWSRLFTPANSVSGTECENIRIAKSGGPLGESTIEILSREKAGMALVNVTIIEV